MGGYGSRYDDFGVLATQPISECRPRSRALLRYGDAVCSAGVRVYRSAELLLPRTNFRQSPTVFRAKAASAVNRTPNSPSTPVAKSMILHSLAPRLEIGVLLRSGLPDGTRRYFLISSSSRAMASSVHRVIRRQSILRALRTG